MPGFVSVFWAEVEEESKDSGPYPQIKVKADGDSYRATVLETSGYHGSPLKGGKVLVAFPDGDPAKAVVIGGIPPKDRQDGFKPGEVGLKNHKNGIGIKLEDDGTISMNATKVKITADIEITGNISMTGAFTQDGIHTDSNGPHTA